MCIAYDDKGSLDICFLIVNLLTSPLIIYSKFIWIGQSNTKVSKVDWKMSDDWSLS